MDYARAVDSGPIGVSPDELNFDCTVSGKSSLKPETAFDDGTVIGIRMLPRTPNAMAAMSCMIAIPTLLWTFTDVDVHR